jgi:predicted alpha/beta hydrolase family esterase
LDTQIKHLDQKSLEALGHWLRRRWYHCQGKRKAAEAELAKLDIPEAQLRSEWAAQLKEQTKPAPRMFYPVSVWTKIYISLD